MPRRPSAWNSIPTGPIYDNRHQELQLKIVDTLYFWLESDEMTHVSVRPADIYGYLGY